MITPLARCITSGCASVHPSASAEKALVSAALLVGGAVVLFFTFALLDEPGRRHNALHWILRASKSCGRCQDQIIAREIDRAFRDSSGHSALTQEVEAPE